jgi:CheY-like chemotaxis protein
VSDKSLCGRRILVVEDEMVILLLIEDTLSDAGCDSVSAAATAELAIDLINEQAFDAAVLDINLKDGDSYSIADALNAHDVPFVFTTGNNVRSIKEGYRDRAVLSKPYRPQQLIQTLLGLMKTAN